MTQQFSFDLDDDVTKHVRIDHRGGSLTVAVRYAVITVLDGHDFSTAAVRFETEPTELGVWVRFEGPLLPWFSWPLIWRRRFF